MLFRRILSLATWITVEPVQVIDYQTEDYAFHSINPSVIH